MGGGGGGWPARTRAGLGKRRNRGGSRGGEGEEFAHTFDGGDEGRVC